MNQNSHLVYTTGKGRVCPACRQPIKQCACRAGQSYPPHHPSSDGVVRIGRETKGRKGKGVTTISGLPGGEGELKALAARLKRCCGSGGTVKDGLIIIQGDHRSALEAELIRLGHRVKIAGG